MPKEKKPTVIYSEEYRKGTPLYLLDLKENANKAIKAELIEVGKMSDDTEYIVCKIIVKA